MVGENLGDDFDPDFCFSCGNCSARFLSLRHLRKHSSDGTCQKGTEPNQTDPPKVSFEYDTNYVVQTETKDSENVVKIKYDTNYVVKTETKDSKNVVKTKTDMKLPKYQCPLCEKYFHIQFKQKHLKSHENLTIYECKHNDCSRIFYKSKFLRTHEVAEHGMHGTDCNFCPYSAKRSQELVKHLRKHTDVKNTICPECGKHFKGDLKFHMKWHRQEYDYECEKCGEKFLSKGNLKMHGLARHSSNPFVCSECGKGFQWESLMKTHMTLHSGEKKWKCRFCDKCFRLFGTRKKHENIHKGIKPYECNMCPKTFRSDEHLRVHIKRHLNQKDFVCNVCTKGFIEPAGLRKHKCTKL